MEEASAFVHTLCKMVLVSGRSELILFRDLTSHLSLYLELRAGLHNQGLLSAGRICWAEPLPRFGLLLRLAPGRTEGTVLCLVPHLGVQSEVAPAREEKTGSVEGHLNNKGLHLMDGILNTKLRDHQVKPLLRWLVFQEDFVHSAFNPGPCDSESSS